MSETISLSSSDLRVIVAAILASSGGKDAMRLFKDFLKQLTEKEMKDELGGYFSFD